jgi:ribosomal protein L35AE/L33A
MLTIIGGRGRQSRIENGAPDAELIEALELAADETEGSVHGVVEKAADPRGLKADGFGFQIEQLPEETAFPMERSVEPGTQLSEARLECGDHRHAEDAVGGDVLYASQGSGKIARVAFFKGEQGKVGRTFFGPLPDEMLRRGGAEGILKVVVAQ